MVIASNNGRAFPRNCYAARIRYAVYNTENFIDATLCNSSEGGMYFESDTDIQPGTEICIRMTDYSPDIHGPEAREGYRAEVMWCRKVFKEENRSCYGVGARFIVNVCDKCGEKVLYSDIHRTDNFLFLCSACFKRLGSMSGKKIKEDVENYLMGNVL